MSTRWQERVDRRRLTVPVGQNVLQASRNQLCDDIDLRFQHHAVPGERPIRYGVSRCWRADDNVARSPLSAVRSFESPGRRVIVVAQTTMIVEFAEGTGSAVCSRYAGAATNIRRFSASLRMIALLSRG